MIFIWRTNSKIFRNEFLACRFKTGKVTFLNYEKRNVKFVKRKTLRPICLAQEASFRGGTPGNVVPIVKVFQNAKNAPDCRTLHIQSQNFPVSDTPDSRKRPRCLDPKHQIPLGSLAFPLLLFNETTTVTQYPRVTLLTPEEGTTTIHRNRPIPIAENGRRTLIFIAAG